MLSWVVTFLVIALIAGILGFGGIAGASLDGAAGSTTRGVAGSAPGFPVTAGFSITGGVDGPGLGTARRIGRPAGLNRPA